MLESLRIAICRTDLILIITKEHIGRPVSPRRRQTGAVRVCTSFFFMDHILITVPLIVSTRDRGMIG